MKNEVVDVELSCEELKKISEMKSIDSDSKAFSELVKEVRATAGLSVEGLARILGVATTEIEQWENGEKMPCGPELSVLCLAHVEPQTLFCRARTEIKGILDA